jgi:hypothetical protein
LVSDAVDVVVHCTRRDERLRVTEVLAVEDLQVAAGTVVFTTTSVFSRVHFDDPLRWTGNLPIRAARAMELHGFDIRASVGGELVR